MRTQTTDNDPTTRQARLMYQRVLVAWASDALRLRAAGLDRPGRRTGAGAVVPGRVRRTAPEGWRLVA